MPVLQNIYSAKITEEVGKYSADSVFSANPFLKMINLKS